MGGKQNNAPWIIPYGAERVKQMCETLSVNVAAKILNLQPQTVRLWMASGKLDIGTTIPGGSRNGRTAYLVSRAKLARLLGQPADHHWEEEER